MKQNIYEKVKGFFRFAMYILIPLAGGSWVGVSCTDTWDDHYEGTLTNTSGGNGGTLWEAIKSDASLSNFASVVEGTGYDRSLSSSQVFTVFAPTNDNFSAAEAAALVEQYKQEKKSVVDDNNTVIKEFVQNHIALYNHSVSSASSDSIVLMNGKYAILSADAIDASRFSQKNKLYGNGVLFTVQEPIHYSANIFEQLRKDSDLDSVRSFIHNSLFYRRDFDASQSVAGGLNDLGETVYLDSVWVQTYGLRNLLGYIHSEDSTYWMTLPTNEEWNRLVEEYTPYFNYSPKAASLIKEGEGTFDSLLYTNPRLAILRGTSFSRTLNRHVLSGEVTSTTTADSVLSVSAMADYNMRQAMWGAPFNYYQYYDPMSEGGIFNGGTWTACSNGRLMKTSKWNVDPLQTFLRWNVEEVEAAYLDVSKYQTNATTKDSAYTADTYYRNVTNDNFAGRVWNNTYVEFSPAVSTVRPIVTIGLTGMLSNVGYDIYLVTATALANDSNATAQQCLPTKFNCTLNYPDANDKMQSKSLGTNITTSGDKTDYILLAEDIQFPITYYGLSEDKPSVTLNLECRVSNNEVTRGLFTRTMRFDCVLVVPHGTLRLVDDLSMVSPSLAGQPGVLMFPHGWSDKQPDEVTEANMLENFRLKGVFMLR